MSVKMFEVDDRVKQILSDNFQYFFDCAEEPGFDDMQFSIQGILVLDKNLTEKDFGQLVKNNPGILYYVTEDNKQYVGAYPDQCVISVDLDDNGGLSELNLRLKLLLDELQTLGYVARGSFLAEDDKEAFVNILVLDSQIAKHYVAHTNIPDNKEVLASLQGFKDNIQYIEDSLDSSQLPWKSTGIDI